MLVSDLFSQYQNSLGSGSKIATKTKGVEQLSKTVASLEKGQVFEGTVNSIKGDKVVLALSSGQTITARLDKSVALSEGQSVFFQVKSNEGGTVSIRPVSSEFGGNPTLLNALKAAGLPENETNLKIINSMMKEQMPVDRESIRNMLNLVRANPGADIDTIVSLKKLELPVNDGMIKQFENYKQSEGAILNMVEDLTESIPKAFSGGEITKTDITGFQKELLSLVGADNASLSEGTGINQSATSLDANTTIGNTNPEKLAVNMLLNEAEQIVFDEEGNVVKNNNPLQNDNVSKSMGNENIPVDKESIRGMLTAEGRSELTRALGEIPNLKEAVPEIFDTNGRINPNIKSSDLLVAVNKFLELNNNVTKQDVLKFFDNPSVKTLLNKVLGNAWTMEPKELLKKNSVSDLYEKIEKDMQKVIESSKHAAHSETNPINNAASTVKDNINFIREVNQMYQYIQIPLKMSGENTTGELYVYSNKKQKRAENDEITAFLHFDMEHLGSTDISIKMAGKKLDTQFFLEDDFSYNIVKKYLPVLEKRLVELGYDCKITVENDSKEVNFVEDFLKQDAKTAGDIRRYSFDVRA